MKKPMSNAAKSLQVYGGYIILFLGLPFLLIPGALLPLVGMSAPTDVWVRVLAMTVLFLGYYYVQAARRELTDLFRWSVNIRFTVPIFFVAFVILGFAPPVLIAFSVPDVSFAIWTALALRSAKPA